MSLMSHVLGDTFSLVAESPVPGSSERMGRIKDQIEEFQSFMDMLDSKHVQHEFDTDQESAPTSGEKASIGDKRPRDKNDDDNDRKNYDTGPGGLGGGGSGFGKLGPG